ncbi:MULTISPECIES: hypothetical protein [unclassified Acinetobacter]|nr:MULTISPECIES: hypothetical protein [unclassified Acinetobacter]
MKIITVFSLIAILGLTACQKRDSDNAKQDKTTSPSSMDKDR